MTGDPVLRNGNGTEGGGYVATPTLKNPEGQRSTGAQGVFISALGLRSIFYKNLSDDNLAYKRAMTTYTQGYPPPHSSGFHCIYTMKTSSSDILKTRHGLVHGHISD